MTYFEKNEQKQFFPMFSMLNAIGEISNVANFTTPCVNIANSAFTQLPRIDLKRKEHQPQKVQNDRKNSDIQSYRHHTYMFMKATKRRGGHQTLGYKYRRG